MPLDTSVRPGQELRLWKPGPALAESPEHLNPGAFRVGDPALLLATLLPSADRAASLPLQGVALADDQIARALAFIAGSCHHVVVLEPLLLLRCLQHEDPEPLRCIGVPQSSVLSRSWDIGSPLLGIFRMAGLRPGIAALWVLLTSRFLPCTGCGARF